MATQLTDMEITKVSLVDAGANQRRFAVLKRDAGEAPDPEKRSLLAKIAKALGIHLDDPVAKTRTFAEIIAGQQLSDALYDSWYTLSDSLWAAIYAYDDNGADLPIEAKQALVAQNLDEFKAWLLGQMETGIAKRDQPPTDARSVAAFVRKVGKKISAARLEQLKTAADALAAVLAEVESSDSEDTTKRAQPEEAPMTSEELAQVQKAIADAVAPIAADVAVLKAAAKPVAKADPDPKPEGSDGDTVSLADVAKAITKLADRVEGLEGARSVRKQLDGQDGTSGVAKSKWAGVLG